MRMTDADASGNGAPRWRCVVASVDIDVGNQSALGLAVSVRDRHVHGVRWPEHVQRRDCGGDGR